MDSESNSDEMTSAENFPNHENKSCPVCKLNFEKLELSSHVCGICSRKVCDSCSISQETIVGRQCNKCTLYISYISAATLQQLQAESLTNKELNLKLAQMHKEIEDGRNRLQDTSEETTKAEERRLIIDTLQHELDKNTVKVQEMDAELKSLNEERNNFEVLLEEKEINIEKITEDLSRLKEEVLQCKKNSNFIPPDCGELYMENQELKEKVKEMEQEHYAYTHQMIEALELLKAQLYRERTENTDLKSMIDSTNEKGVVEALEFEKNRVRELQEELRIAKKQAENIRASYNEEPGFESFGTEARDGPDTTPCKCIIY